ncbi:flagellar hook protein [Roseomonas sp. ACRSG]|nr:flagellar hook protein [Roseomonas sp. ACRSG]
MMDRVSSAGIAIGRQANLQSLQAQLARATAEMSSGRKSDPAREMGVGASLLYRLHDDIQQGGAIKNSTSLAGERMKTMQTAMTSVGKIFEDVSAQILQADALKQQSYGTLAADTPDLLASISDLLNTDFQGQKVFGGTDSGSRPLQDIAKLPAQVQSMLDAAVAANGDAPLDATGVAGLMQDIEDIFAGPGSAFYSLYYGSSSTTGDGKPNMVRIGEGQTLAYDARADNAAFRDAFKALAMTSLLGNGGGKLGDDAKVALADRAGELMRGAQSGLTTLAGTLGTKQARLERVAEIQSRAVDAAAAQINDLEQADYYTLSDQISTMQIQLQATYSITAQLSKLSLVNYL